MTVETAAGTRANPWASAAALAQAMRPKQWIKNGLVVAAPFAGGVLLRPHVLAGAAVAVVVFTMGAAGGYLINDVQDAASDRLHPDKCNRPVASGALGSGTAVVAGALLLVAAPLTALAVDREMLAFLVLVYSGVTLAYTAGLKRVPVVELVLLAGGFVLRPLAGAMATGVHPSGWFLLVCCLGALTVAAGKRQAELSRLGDGAATHRRVLARYSPGGMQLLRWSALPLMLTAYCGWAWTRATLGDRVFGLLSVVPLAAAMLRLGALNDAGAGDAPESVLLHDSGVQLAALGWVALFTIGLWSG